MERRRARRYVRRLRVQLEAGPPGPPGPPVVGTTLNISVSGALILTPRALPLGTRVLAVLQERSRAVTLEARVVRHVRARSMNDEAFAIRFLMPSEVLGELVPRVDWLTGAVELSGSEPPLRAATEPPEEVASPRRGSTPEPDAAGVPEEQGAGGWFEPGLSPFDSQTGTVRAEAAISVEPEGPAEVVPDYRIRIGDAPGLRRRYEDELRYGGLFVNAITPPERNEEVVVAIELAWAGVPPVLAKGRVVHQVPSPPAQAGFALEFDDMKSLIDALKPHLTKE